MIIDSKLWAQLIFIATNCEILATCCVIQDGFTPMAVAIQQRHERVIAALQQAASSAAMMTSSSLTSSLAALTSRLPPLHAAAKRDDVELATSLLQRTAVCHRTSLTER